MDDESGESMEPMEEVPLTHYEEYPNVESTGVTVKQRQIIHNSRTPTFFGTNYAADEEQPHDQTTMHRITDSASSN